MHTLIKGPRAGLHVYTRCHEDLNLAPSSKNKERMTASGGIHGGFVYK